MRPQKMSQNSMLPTRAPASVLGMTAAVMPASGIWIIMAQKAGPKRQPKTPYRRQVLQRIWRDGGGLAEGVDMIGWFG